MEDVKQQDAHQMGSLYISFTRDHVASFLLLGFQRIPSLNPPFDHPVWAYHTTLM